MIALSLTARAVMGLAETTTPPPAADPFPTDLLAAGGDYVHFAAEDAGSVWLSRHGNDLTLTRSGTPETVTQDGVSWVNCQSGCYDILHDGWPGGMVFSVWALTAGARLAHPILYWGGASYSTSNTALRFYGNSKMDVGYSIFSTQWDLPTASGAETLEWSLPSLSLSGAECAVNGVSATRSALRNRSIASDSNCMVVGGARDSAGDSQPGGAMLRDLVITLGWVITPAQRAALESYRQARLAGAG